MAAGGMCGFCRSAHPGKVDRFGQHICATVIYEEDRATLPERTPDGEPRVWLRYQPEPWAFDSDDERAIHLWVRRCEVFTSRIAAIAHLDNLLGRQVQWRQYDPLFPELWIGEDRGHRWLMVPAPVHGEGQ